VARRILECGGPFPIIFSLGIAIFEKDATMRIKGGGRYEKAQP
jgi:hypothetical protein